jgi:hypothetical protein
VNLAGTVLGAGADLGWAIKQVHMHSAATLHFVSVFLKQAILCSPFDRCKASLVWVGA